MKNILIILLVVLTFVSTLQLVFAKNQSEKAPFKSLKKEIKSYEDQFDNNAGNWEIFNMTMASARIEGGHYYIANKMEAGEYIVLNPHDAPLGGEFTIETAIKTVSTSGNHSSYGFVLGASDVSNYYVFQIKKGESYSIKKYQEGVSQELSGGKIKDMVLDKNSFNTLKMEKQGSTIRFYINNNNVAEVSDLSFFGKKVGFLVEGKSEIAVDYTRSQIWPH